MNMTFPENWIWRFSVCSLGHWRKAPWEVLWWSTLNFCRALPWNKGWHWRHTTLLISPWCFCSTYRLVVFLCKIWIFLKLYFGLTDLPGDMAPSSMWGFLVCLGDQLSQCWDTDFDRDLHYPSNTLLAKGEPRIRGLILEASFIS